MNFKHLALPILAAAISLCGLSCQSNCSKTSSQTLHITTDVAEDATQQVYNTIKQLKEEGATELTFEEGVYHFYPEKATERFCYISNHNDVLTHIAFPLDGVADLTIDGNGSTFIIHGRMIPFLVENSSNINIKNLTIDCAEPFHSEATVVAHDKKKKTFDIEISDKFPYDIRNGVLTFTKSYYDHNMGQSMVYDKERVAPIFQTERYGLWNLRKAEQSVGAETFIYRYKQDNSDTYLRDRNQESALKAVQLKKGLVRIFGAQKQLPPIGSILVTKGDQGTNRFAPAFKMESVDGLNIESVTVNHAGGMAFLFENCADVDLYKCNVVPSNGRMISSTADATHFVGCRGKVSLRSCVFQSQLDDAMNVHGTYQEVMDILGKNSVGLRMGHYQQLGFRIAKVGDKVGVVRLSESFHSRHTLSVKSVEFVNGRYQIITFEEDLPADLMAGDLIENITAYPEILVENCDISRNRARGLLISSPVKTTIRNNFFSTEMEALLLPVESGHWFESGNAANVLIEGNTFQDCTNGGMDRGVICFRTDDESENIAFSNIRIVNNQFNHFDDLILELTNIDGFEFSGNTITNSGTYPQQYPGNPVVITQYCKNMIFKDNIYEGNATKMIECRKGGESAEFN